MPQKQMTKNQHFVPKVYLRGFSLSYPEYKKNAELYVVDTKTMKLNTIPKSIKSLCYEIDLYELKAINGDYINQNHYEKCFDKCENMFKGYRKRIEEKLNAGNYDKYNFLSEEEISFFVVYMVLQMLRMPKVIKGAEDFFVETGKLGEPYNRNLAIYAILSSIFGNNDQNNPFFNIFNYFYNQMINMDYRIIFNDGTFSQKFFTSDNPVILVSSYTDKNVNTIHEYDFVIFPITSNICLSLYGNMHKKSELRNCLCNVNEPLYNFIERAIVKHNSKQLYFNHFVHKTTLRRYKRMRDNEE